MGGQPSGLNFNIGQVNLQTDQAVVKSLAGGELDPIERDCVHDENTFGVVISRNNFDIEPEYDYVGIVTRNDRSIWKEGEVKLLMRKIASESRYTGAWLTQDKTRHSMEFVDQRPNMIQASLGSTRGDMLFVRIRKK